MSKGLGIASLACRCLGNNQRLSWRVLSRLYSDSISKNGGSNNGSNSNDRKKNNGNNNDSKDKTTKGEQSLVPEIQNSGSNSLFDSPPPKHDVKPTSTTRKQPFMEFDRLTMKEVAERRYLDTIVDSTASKKAIPRHADVLIIGSGMVGVSTAFWLKKMSRKTLNVVVVEKDPWLTKASSMLSVGGIRHQFSIEENVKLSMFTSEFIRRVDEYLTVPDEDELDISFNHQGYLFLATEDKIPLLEKNVTMQRDLGAEICILSKEELARKFPWLQLDGIAAASYGTHGEGWFDPWLLLRSIKRKCLDQEVVFVEGEVVDFVKDMDLPDRPSALFDPDRLVAATVRAINGSEVDVRFGACVNAAGPWAGEVARMAGIGTGEGVLAVPLPVEPRKRYVYCAHCPDGPSIDAPLTVDVTGAYFRRDGLGGNYLMGASPLPDQEPDISNLEVDYSFFENEVWPILAQRVPSFECLKVQSAWAGYYDYNYFDQNLIIGPHPYYKNFLFANGMSGHGIQQAVAIGHALAELIVYADYKAIDLDRFSFDRVLKNQPLFEENIV